MKTLYLRISITIIVVMLASSVTSFLLANVYYQYSLKPYNDQKITHMAEDIVNFYEENPEVRLDQYLNHVGDLGYQIYLVDASGEGVAYGGAFRDQTLSDKVIEQVLTGNVYHGIRELDSKFYITGFFDNALENSIGMPMVIGDEPHALFLRPNIEQQFGELRVFFAKILVMTLILSVLFALISTVYVVKPIRKLTEATKRIARGQYRIQLNVRRKDEIGQLATHFTQMAKGLEQLEAMRQEFVSNVSHEIQSPLASIQGFAETLRTGKLPPEQQEHYLAIIAEESRRMSQLSKQLLTLASLDKEEEVIEKSKFDLAEQIKQVVFMIEWSWREKEIVIEMELPATLIYADKKLLHQVWVNLITNSIKFTGEGGTLAVSLHPQENGLQVEVRDTGVGISEEDLPNIFHRFYKGDKARNREGGSSGLGLAIVHKIVELHDGHIDVKSRLGGGTIFTIWLPRL